MIRIVRSIASSRVFSNGGFMFAGIIKHHSVSLMWSCQPHYSFAFFKNSYRNRQYLITQKIKSTTTSEQLLAIIKQKGQVMNIVNLTAILDRMQEQQMINTKEIIQFVITKLKMQEYIFRQLPVDCIRALCNIICYLGNIKNRELNQYFLMVDYSKVIFNCNNIQKVMLINGLIRLGLFTKVFTVQPDGRPKKILFTLKFLEGLDINQALSIWLAFYQQEALKNGKQHQIIEMFLNKKNDEITNRQQINMRTYTYAMTCFVEIYKRKKEIKNGQLYQIIKYNLPNQLNKENLLRPHQLSLLLKAIHKFNKLSFAQKNKTITLHFTDQFKKLINKNVRHICKKKNITLRNLANVYKELNQTFEVQQKTAVSVIETFNSILEDEIAFRRKHQDYEEQYKVDSLSLCSLSWKVNQLHTKKNYLNKHTLQNIMKNIQVYLLQLIPLKYLQKLTVNELLMLYSGYYEYCKKYEMSFNPQFEQLTSSLIKKPELKFNIKELTFLFTYFKQMKFGNPQLCKFLRQKIDQVYQSSLKDNKIAELILEKKGCIMDFGPKCKKCFQNPANTA